MKVEPGLPGFQNYQTPTLVGGGWHRSNQAWTISYQVVFAIARALASTTLSPGVFSKCNRALFYMRRFFNSCHLEKLLDRDKTRKFAWCEQVAGVLLFGQISSLEYTCCNFALFPEVFTPFLVRFTDEAKN